MARERKDIAKPTTAQPPAAPAVKACRPRLSLAKPPKDSHLKDTLHTFVRALARDLARADHRRET